MVKSPRFRSRRENAQGRFFVPEKIHATLANPDRDHRVPGRGHGFRLESQRRCVCATVERTRLDREPHHRDRVSLGGRASRALHRDRGRVRPAEGRCHCHVGNRHRRGNAGDVGHPDCVCSGHGAGEHQPNRTSGAPRAVISRACRCSRPSWQNLLIESGGHLIASTTAHADQ
jgi:hypothetical protein